MKSENFTIDFHTKLFSLRRGNNYIIINYSIRIYTKLEILDANFIKLYPQHTMPAIMVAV